MDLPAPRDPEPPLSLLRDRAGGIIATATVLALLYLGRDVLVPITLAVILSLAVAPWVNGLRRAGVGQTTSVLVAVLSLTLLIGTTAAVLGLQVVRMAASLPQYEVTIRNKLATLNEMTVGRLNSLSEQAGRLIQPEHAPPPTPPGVPAIVPRGASSLAVAPVSASLPGTAPSPATTGLRVLNNLLGSIWTLLQTAGIVLVVLVFLLLEHEAVRDRFIRIAGGNDIRATTIAINDAGERLSKFFISQFLVNLGVAGAVAMGLAIIGLPHALVWGVMAGVLRFVPYVGVWIAALFSVLLAAAVDPGWTLAVATVALYLIVELIAGQLIEPQLYGHTTGLSPLSVVIAAIFWSWLWGPIGLILSTPLTLCLLVAGRHIKALGVLDVLLGDSQALTMPQRFPHACLVTVFLRGMLLQPGSAMDSLQNADREATSLSHAMQICLNMQEHKDQAAVESSAT